MLSRFDTIPERDRRTDGQNSYIYRANFKGKRSVTCNIRC